MNKELYMQTASERLLEIFKQVKSRQRVPDKDKFRLEGFLEGAVFLGFSSSGELNQLIANHYQKIHGKSLEQRRLEVKTIKNNNLENKFDEKYCNVPTSVRLGIFTDQ